MLTRLSSIMTSSRTATRAALASLLMVPCLAFAQAQAYINQPVNL